MRRHITSLSVSVSKVSGVMSQSLHRVVVPSNGAFVQLGPEITSKSVGSGVVVDEKSSLMLRSWALTVLSI